MPGFGDLVQKAFYLGVGAASYAAEKAGTTLSELRVQAQKIADEMVARGEMTAEDAKRMVDEMVTRAQATDLSQPASSQPAAPRQIEILTDDEPTVPPSPAPPSSASPPTGAAEDLRQQVAKLQEELQRLKRQ